MLGRKCALQEHGLATYAQTLQMTPDDWQGILCSVGPKTQGLTAMKRQRGRNRNNNNRNNNNPNRSLDSNGPDVKVRGNASTIYEKYTQLARDAQLGGSRVKAENLLQHAEHYLRLMNAQEAEKKARDEEREAQQAARRAQNGQEEDGDDNQNRRPRRNERRPKHVQSTDDPSEASENDSSEAKVDAPKAKTREKRAPKSDDTPAGLEVVEPAADAKIAPKRRRAAPKRKDTAVDAAE